MENLVIESVLAEEAQAALTVQAAKDKAAALVRKAQTEALNRRTQAEEEAAAFLKDCAEKAKAADRESEARADEEIRLLSLETEKQARERMDAAADAALFLLR